MAETASAAVENSSQASSTPDAMPEQVDSSELAKPDESADSDSVEAEAPTEESASTDGADGAAAAQDAAQAEAAPAEAASESTADEASESGAEDEQAAAEPASAPAEKAPAQRKGKIPAGKGLSGCDQQHDANRRLRRPRAMAIKASVPGPRIGTHDAQDAGVFDGWRRSRCLRRQPAQSSRRNSPVDQPRPGRTRLAQMPTASPKAKRSMRRKSAVTTKGGPDRAIWQIARFCAAESIGGRPRSKLERGARPKNDSGRWSTSPSASR